MTKRLRLVLLFLALGTFGVLVLVFHPQAEEVEESETPTVSDSEVQMYIKVYSAMQQDHDLTIDSAIAPYKISLDDFRQVERRIQNQPHLVDRVREALTEQAKAHSVFAQSVASPTPASTPAASEHPRPKKQ